MKAILTSSDLTQIDGGIELAERMIGKPRSEINIAVINEASAVEFGDHRWAIDALRNLADNFGGNVEIIHLLAIPLERAVERVMAADMLFVLGGNTEWLKSVFDKTGFSGALPGILGEKLYVGSSAGSMVLGHQPSYENQAKVFGPYDTFGVENYLDLLDLSIMPHFRTTHWGDRKEEWVIRESASVPYPVYAIEDNAAVVVDGDEIRIIGDGFKLVGGEVK